MSSRGKEGVRPIGVACQEGDICHLFSNSYKRRTIMTEALDLKKAYRGSGGGSGFFPRKDQWPQDILSGFIVFLLALPLSVGIAMASGFPAMSGLMTAAIGGIVVGLFAGSPLSIKGPAAGMIVIILGAVEELGRGQSVVGVKATLAAIAVGGVIQMVMGQLKFGKISQAFPISSVHGMLSAIGVIIISKQAHSMMGRIPSAKEPFHLLLEIPALLMHLNPAITVVGGLSLGIMVVWPFISQRLFQRFLKRIPAPLVVVSFAIVASWALGFSHEHNVNVLGYESTIGPQYLVNIPSDLSTAYISPDFSQIQSATWLKWLFMIVAVGSLESLLTVKAVEALDRERRPSDANRDLTAVGFGNFLCGMVGGLPMIAEVVRSSANLNANAQTRWSNIFHGLFIALFAIGLPGAIHMIPTAALSGLLVFTGYRLASPKHWLESWHKGPEQFAVFAITLVVTIMTDLLIGIGVGLACELILNLSISGTLKNLTVPSLRITQGEKESREETTVVGVYSPLTFANLLPMLTTLRQVKARKIQVDLSHSKFIDCTSMIALTAFTQELGYGNQSVELTGLEKFKTFSKHPYAARVANHKLDPVSVNNEILMPEVVSSRGNKSQTDEGSTK